MKKTEKKKILTRAVTAAAATILALAAVVAGIFIYAYANVDFKTDEAMFESSVRWNSTTFYADSDRSDAEYTPIAVETAGSMKKTFYPIEEISPYLRDGFISVEDRIFYTHGGVDIRRTLYAALNYITKRQRSFGASTITQQVVKNISGDNEPTLTRKLTEIIRALNIEQHYSKDEILEVYLNVIPMGDNIYGVGLASRCYFGKEPSELSPEEAATLIGITNAPTAYNPYKNPDACLKKRNTVLRVMHETGIIDSAEYERAASRELEVLERELREDRYDSWFTETVIADITRDLAKKHGISEHAANLLLMGGGYSVYTTMDTEAQAILEKHFRSRGDLPPEQELAMVITDAASGDLVAIAGRVGEKRSNRILNHATVPHIPASALKPLALYAPMIDSGEISWSTVIDDVPGSFYETEDGFAMYPHNSPDVYDGLTTVADALRLSKNTVAVSLYKRRGAERIYNDLIERYGISTLVYRMDVNGSSVTDLATAPLALGQLSVGIPLTKMTECYGAFAADGVLHKQRSYIRVTDHEGRDVLVNEPHSKRIYKPTTARIMNQLLMRVTASGTARSVTLKNIVDTAGKTGTSGGSRDKVFIGYTPYFVGGIWTGFESGERTVTSNAHMALWDRVMCELHGRKLADAEPRRFSTDGLLYRPYCMDSGELYSDLCMLDPRGSRMAYGYFTGESAPRTLCSRHIVCMYDSVSKGIAAPECPTEHLVRVALISVPDRKFPIEVYITDAEFVYRGTNFAAETDIDENLPYFYPTLEEGEYAGISQRRRQFNAGCRAHRNKKI